MVLETQDGVFDLLFVDVMDEEKTALTACQLKVALHRRGGCEPGVSAKRGSKWNLSGKLTGFKAIRVDMVEFDLFSPWDADSEESDLRVTKNRLVPHSIRGSPVLPEERLVRTVETAQEDGVFDC